MARKRFCVYCSCCLADTRDHAIGKQFFPRPRPSNLLVVPACARCNQMIMTYEDYARALLLFGPGGNSKAGTKIWESGLRRSLLKDHALRRRLAAGYEHVLVQEASGTVAQRPSIRIDWDVLGPVLQKWAMALHYIETAAPMRPQAAIQVGAFFPEEASTLIDDCRPGRRSWPGVFEYWYYSNPARLITRIGDAFVQPPHGWETCSVWAFRAYEKYGFYAWARAPGLAANAVLGSPDEVPLSSLISQRL